MRIAKTNRILIHPVNKLFAVENTYHDTNQTDKAINKYPPLHLLFCEWWIFVKENPDRKKANSTLQHLKTDFQSMMREERLDALSVVYINRDTFLDYDKIIDIYAFKYPRRMLLINPLSVETFNARKTCKAYINSRIFSSYFIVVTCKKFCFASTN